MADEPSGNVAKLLNDLFGIQSKQLNLISDLVGAAADISGAVTGVSGIIAAVNFFLGQKDPTEIIIQEVQQILVTLGLQAKANDIISRLRDIGQQLGPPEAVMKDLTVSGAVHPEDIQKCQAALATLSKEGFWLVSFLDQMAWTDAGEHMWPVVALGALLPADRGYGRLAPAADSNGIVFNYFYVLAAYLEALTIFLAAGRALFPDFVKQFADNELRPAAAFLAGRHDRIVGDGKEGIVELPTEPWDREKLFNTLNDFDGDVPPGITPQADPPLQPPLLPPPFLGGVNIEYGAVEKFSGASSISAFKLSFQEIDALAGPAVFNKFLLRLERKKKQVYLKVGLLDVWKAANALKTMVGDPPMPRPNGADWSFRGIMTTAQIPPRPDGFHLSDFINFIHRTAPDDTQRFLTTSFQSLLIPSLATAQSAAPSAN